jgi:hypothetical protein
MPLVVGFDDVLSCVALADQRPVPFGSAVVADHVFVKGS